ncbi:MAG: hypothetical protein IKB75_02570 [Clostridia bacterium]|nr:hypothetical protein [Clostridia bacterium]
MFSKLGYRLQKFMYGRYGNDELSRFLSVTSLILIVVTMILTLFTGPGRLWLNLITLLLYVLSWGLMIWSIVRGFSKNLTQRRKERATYLRLAEKWRAPFRLWKNKHRDRKTHRYFKCKRCHAVLRVPKGKGEIIITCPKCQNKLAKKT